MYSSTRVLTTINKEFLNDINTELHTCKPQVIFTVSALWAHETKQGERTSRSQAIGECHANMKRVFISKWSFNKAVFGISLPYMVKWMLAIGQNLADDSLNFKLSTVSDKLIMQPSSRPRS
eukprot:TRINITY_DN13803_c0_g1_i2.p1 TRINITY_DN13803_c0_g1~~TRINITY_DN13803_c0_g1_i2.p1  ORF type:complete len:121 (-),score=17.15 TRINITY_DN13803_c0_g1_i2:155-517(-)